MTHERHEASGEMPGFVPFKKGPHEVVKPIHNHSGAPVTIKSLLKRFTLGPEHSS